MNKMGKVYFVKIYSTIKITDKGPVLIPLTSLVIGVN